jgi:F0F1-type ATP synthase membrane subunit b/b'
MENTNKNADERIAELEAELDRVRRERDVYEADAHSYRRQLIDEIPTITEAEAIEMMVASQSKESLHDIIAEYEAELGRP